MKVIKATIPMLESRTLVIGFQAENQRTQVRIDCAPIFAEYPHATPSLAIKPPAGETYPVFVNREGNEVVWTILSENLALVGDGELQLTFVKDSVIAKTIIGHIRILRSLVVDGEMPDPVAQWIDDANAKLAEVDAQIVELEGMVDTATDAATRAEQSASTASTKAEQAAGSAATATEKATEATNAAGTATAKAAEAQTAAQTATTKATAAAESERIATAKAGEATTAAETATAKAEQATESAETATEKAGDASASATAAHASEINAAESADGAFSAEVGANAAKRAAETSATQAGISEQNAGIAAQTATQKAAEATQSATNAAIFAGTATTKAEEAAASAQAASDAQTAVEQTAEQLADSLEQIDQNTQDIAELDERKANVDGYYPDMTVGNAEQLNSSKYVENSEPYTLRTSGGTSDIGNREYVDAVVGGTLAWNQAVRDSASENSTDFAEIVTVTDAVEDAAGVRVKLEPVQDLHGYDHPWPAGGGKNLLKNTAQTVTKDGITFTVNDDGTVLVNGTATANTELVLTTDAIDVPGDYIVNGCPDGGNRQYWMNFKRTVNGVSDWKQEYGSGFTVTGGTIQNVGVFVQKNSTLNNVLFKPMIRLASETDATYAPYSNICPVTGWTAARINRTGKNLLPMQAYKGLGYNAAVGAQFNPTPANHNYVANGDGTFTISNLASWEQCCLMIPTPVAGNYYLSLTIDGAPTFCISKVNTKDIVVSVPTYLANPLPSSATIARTETITEPGNLLLYIGSHSTEITITNPICQYEEPITAYEPYAGQTYDITLPTEAGTVYGGELIVNVDGSGSLVVDRVTDTFTKDSDWYGFQTGTGNSSAVVQLSNYQNVKYINNYASFNGAISSIGTEYANYWTAGRPNEATNTDFAFAYSANGVLRVHRSDVGTITDLESFKNAFPDAQFCYYLATPITYTLTASEIRTLLGQNNIWADTGDVALTYTGTDEHLTLESGKMYLTRLSGTDSMLLGSGQEITAAKGTDNVFDLTQMFGTAVADYVYGQGAAFFRKWFGKQWYPYNTGELKHVEGLQSHDMVGFNLWDEEWELGTYSTADGSKVSTNDRIRNKNPIPVLPNTTYYIGSSVNATWIVPQYDTELNFIKYQHATNSVFTTDANCHFINFSGATNYYGATYKHDICINLAHNNSRNGEYEPYEKHSYPLDSTVVLRGIPKVDSNGVYWDGDRYLPDGTVERRYGVVEMGQFRWMEYSGYPGLFYINVTDIPFKVPASNTVIANAVMIGYQSFISRDIGKTGYTKGYFALAANRIYVADDTYTGNVSEFKAAMQGVLLVYELATPTTETAQPYHSTQWVSDWGTEEFVSTGIIPVGTETRYPANLRDKLQHLPDAASGNGSYLITQTDGQMVLTPFPAPPSTAGNYVLKATVTNGVATYTWEVAT